MSMRFSALTMRRWTERLEQSEGGEKGGGAVAPLGGRCRQCKGTGKVRCPVCSTPDGVLVIRVS